MKGKAKTIDLRQSMPKEKGDVCFMFELIDIIPFQLTQNLIKNIKAKTIVVTFPKIKKSSDRYKRKLKFESFIKSKNLIKEKFRIGRETVYIIKK